jgi:asparagine synthase (glutamine-hydrolysing)
MCGLFLTVGYAPDKRGLDTVAHRGPDGEGWKVFESPAGPVALGHRRLSIIDLDDRALQPMASADSRHWLIFNGEIYNYLELRAELAAAGSVFRTVSDAEVLLEAYRAWGAACLSRFVGMFAFAIFDDRDKTLFLARDHLGVKPLVWHAREKGFAFASEIKQLLQLPTFSRRMNRSRARDFLVSGVTDHRTSTLFADAMNVSPGDYAVIDLRRSRPGESITFKPYWRPPLPDEVAIKEDEAAARFKTLFLDSIRLQMRADVRVGSCLSGGLDSSSIVCAEATIRPSGAEPFNVVSAVFPGTSVDESRFIDAVVERTGVVSHRVTLDPASVFEDLDATLAAQDEPYGSTSIHAQRHVFRAARQAGVKVMLDGQGADEILGGYHGCFHYHYLRLIREARLFSLLETLRERKAWHGVEARSELAFVANRLKAPLRRLAGRATTAPHAWLRVPDIEGDVIAGAIAEHGLTRPRELGQYCVLLARSTNLPMLLRYEDRNSMAHSIEARVPFLDHRLVEFCLRLGHQHKIVGGDTKRVLRTAMKGVLPEIIRQRRDKLGFATPEEVWFKGPLRTEVLARAEKSVRAHGDIFEPSIAIDLLSATLDGRRPFDFLPWRVVVFGAWVDRFGMT